MKEKRLFLVILCSLIALIALSSGVYYRYFVYNDREAVYRVYLNQPPDIVYRGEAQDYKVTKDLPVDAANHITWLAVTVKPESKAGGKEKSSPDKDMEVPENPEYLDLSTALTPGIDDFTKLSTEAIGTAESTHDMATAAMHWIRKNVNARESGIVQALLETQADYIDDRLLYGINGESAEYATIFSGLMRAKGVPTRTIGGHIFLNGENTIHIWNECWVEGSGWLTVDVFNQRLGADNRYIRFVEGADYTKYMEMLTTIEFGVERTNW